VVKIKGQRNLVKHPSNIQLQQTQPLKVRVISRVVKRTRKGREYRRNVLELYDSKTDDIKWAKQRVQGVSLQGLKKVSSQFSSSLKYVTVIFETDISHQNKIIQIYDVANGEPKLKKPIKHVKDAECIESTDGDFCSILSKNETLQLYNLANDKPVWKTPIENVLTFKVCKCPRRTKSFVKLIVVTQVSEKKFDSQIYIFPTKKKPEKWQEEDPKERVEFIKKMVVEEKPGDIKGLGLPGFGPAGIKFVPRKKK